MSVSDAVPDAIAGARLLDPPGSAAISPMVNAMTVDVEDYFHAEALAPCFPRDRWDAAEWRVEGNVDRLLSLFADADVAGTFFILGCVAERFPRMVRRIADAGHESASHGPSHCRVDHQSAAALVRDVRSAKAIIEDASGQPVVGYRAASFSIGRTTLWALEALEKAGYRYSSSIYPIRHDLYGMPEAPRFPFVPRGLNIVEIPMTTAVRLGRNVPCAGGGYFRLLPYWLSRANLRQVNGTDRRPCVFYLHPWEIDPGQPRQTAIPRRSRWRHYTNLDAMEPRLRRLLADFRWDRLDRVFPGIATAAPARGDAA